MNILIPHGGLTPNILILDNLLLDYLILDQLMLDILILVTRFVSYNPILRSAVLFCASSVLIEL